MPDIIELEPAPSPYFDEAASRAGGLGDSFLSSRTHLDSELAVAYAQRAARYRGELKDGQRQRYGALPPGDPTVEVRLPGGAVRVVFDEELDRQLLELYVLHGWTAITAISAALDKVVDDRVVRLLHPWPHVQIFFRFTRNRLILLIRAALIEIEQHATDHVTVRLTASADRINQSWQLLAVDDSPIGGARGGSGANARDRPMLYRIGNRSLADRLYPCISRVILAMDDVRALRAKVQRLRHDVAGFEDGPPPTGVQLDLQDAEQHLEQRSQGLEDLLADVEDLAPLATLVVPMLSDPLTQPLMEHRLGLALDDFRGESERLLGGVLAGARWLERTLPVWERSRPLEDLLDDQFPGIETEVVKQALDNANDDPAYLPIISERALDRLVDEGGPIRRDSFAYVVWAHFRTELILQLEAEREFDEAVERVFGAVARLTALLSLGLWMTPAGAAGAGAARIGTTIIGFGLLAYQAYSVFHSLSLFDRQIDLAIVDVDRADLMTIGRLSELRSMREEYFEQVVEMVALELTLIIAAGAFPEFKMLLHLRGYYFDLDTLLQG